MGTGRRLRIDTVVMALFVSMLWKQAEPTRPVAPVRIRCIFYVIVARSIVDVKEIAVMKVFSFLKSELQRILVFGISR